MAFSFPLTTAQFFGGLSVVSARFWLPDAMTMERSEGGEVFTADRGPRLWQAEFTLRPFHHRDAAVVESRLALLRQAGRSFFAYDPRKQAPYYDQTGALLTGYAPKIASLTGSREMALNGCPPSYDLRRGDYLAFAYASSPVRYALHQLVTDAEAGGGGVTGTFEVVPPIRAGASVGADVTLVQPACKMVYEPGSYNAGYGQGNVTTGATFRAIQTFR